MTLGKHFIGTLDGDSVVVAALRSLLVHDPSLCLIPSKKVLFRKQPSDTTKVIVLSGGGSGHEPAHAGYVGDGMLDVAVAGNIFASPSATQILAGLEAVDAGNGALFIVKNYTGDKLNFGLAAEKAKAKGCDVRTVFVDDDVAIQGNDLVGCRGLAGTVFVHKIAGAAATKGSSLEDVERVASKTAQSMASVAVSLDRCSVPGRRGQEKLADDEVEYGMGIHNEPGAERAKLPPLQDMVSRMLEIILRNSQQTFPGPGGVAAMVNNLGGLSVLELHVVADEILRQLNDKVPEIRKVFIGTFVTALDGPGVSVTLLNLDNELEMLLDAPTTVHAWPKSSSGVGIAQQIQTLDPPSTSEDKTTGPSRNLSTRVLQRTIAAIANTVRIEEPLITKYDSIVGDGDCGTTLLQGVNALSDRFIILDSDEIDLGKAFRIVADTVEESMGGTSGAIYAIFFNAVANALVKANTSVSGETSTRDLLRSALMEALGELRRYTRAGVGHRTLMDALIPFIHAFAEKGDFTAGLSAAADGSENTRMMQANFGRSSYVCKDQLSLDGGIPDPGAIGVVSILKGLSSTIIAQEL